MRDESLKKGLILVFIANFINLLINILRGFIVPKYLAVDTYAMIKNYQLYISYIGVFHLGYLDGIYLKYGGRNIDRISNAEISSSHTNIVIFQLLMMFLCLPFGIITKNYVFVIFAFSLLPANLIEYFKNIFQATGEFRLYSNIIYVLSIFTFVGYLLLIFVFQYTKYQGYVIVYFIAYLFIWIYLEVIARIKLGIKFNLKINILAMISDCRNGFSLMLGNFSSILLTSMDRWFVKFLFTVADFAYYSFAVSIESLITVFISPVVTTFYNYLCKEKNIDKIINIKKMCMVAGIYMISLAFPVKFILQTYLVKYIESINILFILFSTQALYLVIKGIYVNIYKARGMQKLYLKQLTAIIIIAFILNSIFCMFQATKESIAFATLVSVCIWWILCDNVLQELRIKTFETGIYFSIIFFYLLCGKVINNPIIGLIVYIIVISVVSIVCFKNTMENIFNNIKIFIKKNKTR